MRSNKKAIILALIMCLSIFMSFGQAVVKAGPSIDFGTKTKEVIFMVDRSMATGKERLAEIKNEINELSEKLIESDSNLSVSLIYFNGRAETLVEKVKDAALIKNAKTPEFALGFSNPIAAIEKARAIEKADKNYLVLYTSSYPAIGPIRADGPYTSRDHFYFRNANALKNTADELGSDYDLITVLDMASLNNKDYAFTKKLYTELSKKTYLNGDSKGILDYVHGSTAIDKVSEDKKPIVFVPGIAGSELYSIDEKYVSDEERKTGMISSDKEFIGKRIWIPLGYGKSELSELLNIKNNAYGLQEGDLRYANLLTRHTGPAASYTLLIDALIKHFPDRPVYLFSYDWRKSNEITSEKLDAFIDSINEGGKLKVDLIAHSMGGLVSSHYLAKHDDKVDKYISFGTPYEGAPHAYNEMTNGNILGGIADFFLNNFLNIDSKVVQDYDGLLELYPTKKMLDKYPYQVVMNQNQLDSELLKNNFVTYDSLVNKLHLTFASRSLGSDDVQEQMQAYLGSERFTEFLRRAQAYRAMGSMDESVYMLHRPNSMFIVGEGMDTQVSGYYTENVSGLSKVKKLMTKEGDGLVPLYSATMGMELDEMPEELRSKFKVVNGNHMGILMDAKCLDMMCHFLLGR